MSRGQGLSRRKAGDSQLIRLDTQSATGRAGLFLAETKRDDFPAVDEHCQSNSNM